MNLVFKSHFLRWLRAAPRLAGAVSIALGVAVIAGWHARWVALIQVLPQLAPMQYNTALGFIAGGIALMCLTARRPLVARFLGGGVALLGLLTMAEYVAARNLGIDQIFFHSYVQTQVTFIGRMSPLTAACFTLTGLSIALVTGRRKSEARDLTSAILASVAAIIALVAIAGYLLDIEPAYGWGSYARMAVHTAAAFSLLNLGLLAFHFTASPWSVESGLSRWLPASASAAMIAMIAVVSLASSSDLETATRRRQHSNDVLAAADVLLDDLTDMQRGVRAYVFGGEKGALDLYLRGTNAAPIHLSELQRLTIDNPGQQQSLATLSNDLQTVIVYSREFLGAFRSRGLASVTGLDSTINGLSIMNLTRARLKEFTDEETRLLNRRSAAVAASFQSNNRLLVFASAMAGGLLVFATGTAAREIRRRKRSESERAANEETLRQFIIHNPVGVAMFDHQMRYIQASKRWLEEHRITGDVIGRTHYELFPDTPQRWRDEHQQALAGAILHHKEDRIVLPDGSDQWWERELRPWQTGDHQVGGLLIFKRDITQRKFREAEREKLIADLQKAVAQIRTLGGLIPICAWCKNIRCDEGFWHTVEEYVCANTDATFSHGLCPVCALKMETNCNALELPAHVTAKNPE